MFVAGCGVDEGGILLTAFGAAAGHGGGTLEQGTDIVTGQGDGEQAHGSEDREAAAYVVGNHEGTVALLIREALQGTAGLVGDGHDAGSGLGLAVALLDMLLDNAESHCGFSGGAGLGDDHGCHRFILDVVYKLGVIFLREVEAGEDYVNAFLIEAEGVRESLEGCLCSEIGAADTDDHGHLHALVLPFLSDVLAAPDDGLRSVRGQIEPA